MNVITYSSIKKSLQAGIHFTNKVCKEKGTKNQIFVFGKKTRKEVEKCLRPSLHVWQWRELEGHKFQKRMHFQTDSGFLFYLPLMNEDEKNYVPKQLQPSPWGLSRDKLGTLFYNVPKARPLELFFVNCSRQQMLGALLGVGLAKYSFKTKESYPLTVHVNYSGEKLTDKDLVKIEQEYKAVNLARHFVNMPASVLHPTSYVKFIRDIFKEIPVKVWGPQHLKKEKMNLILGVGEGAKNGPYLVHIAYRGGAKSQKPIAFVGKGITFDSGGLNIKPASNMRFMKKDMGGSSTLLGVAYYLLATKAKINCDFYLAIAENSVSHEAFRPGDVLMSKKGLSVEVHNTDAEGRLVIADALFIAAQQKPKALIDVATLTGAVKYGLGAYLPGLFCSDEELQHQLLQSANNAGEPLWPMPLDPQQESSLNSHVADMVNCADGFGGAISAALFLQKFTEDVPWAHLDIYAWSDSPRGALREKGGSGQMVQTLLKFLGVGAE